MVRVSESARIISSAPRGASELEQAAYSVWHTAKTGRRLSASESPISGRSGALYNGALSGVVMRIWPSLRHDDAAARQMRSQIYALLRASDNGHCVSNDARTKTATWWLADDWQRPVGVVIRGGITLTHAEKKLTPAEAGEDREAAPVTVTTTSPAPAAPKANPAERLADAHEQRRRERQRAKELVYESVSTGVQPMTVREVQVDSGVERDESSVREFLRELVAEGKLFTRVETSDERVLRCGGIKRATRSRLYHWKNPVPERTRRVVVSGVEETPSPVTHPMTQTQVEQATARAMRSLIRRRPFTAQEFSDLSGINDTTTRRILGELVARDMLTVAKRDRPRKWRISQGQETRVRQFVTDTLGQVGPSEPAPPKLQPAATSEPAAPTDDVHAALRVITQALEERRHVEDPRVQALERENRELRAKLERIESRMRELFG